MHPIAMCSAVFRSVYSFVVFVADAIGNPIEDTL